MESYVQISPASGEASFEFFVRDALCTYASRYASPIVRFGDTYGKMRS